METRDRIGGVLLSILTIVLFFALEDRIQLVYLWFGAGAIGMTPIVAHAKRMGLNLAELILPAIIGAFLGIMTVAAVGIILAIGSGDSPPHASDFPAI